MDDDDDDGDENKKMYFHVACSPNKTDCSLWLLGPLFHILNINLSLPLSLVVHLNQI